MGCLHQKICRYMINLLPTYLLTTTIEAVPKGYFPMHDDLVVGILVLALLGTLYVLCRSRKFVLAVGKEFIFGREQVSLFANSTGADSRSMAILFIQFCLMAALLLQTYFISLFPEIINHVSTPLLLGNYIIACLAFILVKTIIYRVFGWIFFNGSVTQLCLEAYVTMILYMGILLLPAILCIVFVIPDFYVTTIIAIVCLLFAKLLTLYKWLKLFSEKIHGSLLLILYFCALEIMPCLVFYKGLVELNNCWIIKI